MKKHADATEKEIRQAMIYKLSNEAKAKRRRMLAADKTAIDVSDVGDDSQSENQHDAEDA